MQLPAEFMKPNYDDGSIANVPATIAAILGAPFSGLPPLKESLWRPLSGGAKRVVLLIVDALGSNLLQEQGILANGFLGKADVVGQLTSVFPSTTVAALSSLWTGAAPAQHGMVGLRLFMPEYAVTTQMLHFTPTFGKYPDALIHAGLEPETFLQSPGIAQQLAQSGIETHAFKGREIIDSALSKMHGRGVSGDHGVSSVADMLVQMRQLLEQRAGESLYACAYWPMIDSLSHIYGWSSDSVAAELRAIMAQIESEFVTQLSPAARKDTVFFIVADHGQVVTPPSQQIYLEDHPELRKMLFMRPAGEPRTAFLYAKHGLSREITGYINHYLSEAMIAIGAEEALGENLLGAEPRVEQALERVGDVIVTMRQGYVLLTESDRNSGSKMLGRHGGMTVDEMSVPWLGFRLDG